jgi:hypothetical protein
MSAKRGTAMRVLVLAFIAMAVAGVIAFRSPWTRAPEPTIPYQNAADSLPVLRALAKERVTFLRVQDWCQAYSDDRERRANELTGSCTLKDGYKVFDGASEKRFLELRRTLKELPYGVNWITIEYGPGGDLRTATLSIRTVNPFRRDSLVYEPGYTLSKGIPGEIETHRIDTDWYYVWEDWN